MIEKNAVQKKIEIELEVLKKEKSASFDKLIHKYKNRKLDLDIQQKQEKIYNDNLNLYRASKFL